MYDVVLYVRTRLTATARMQRGASAVEYGLLVALVTLAILAGVMLLGGSISGIFNRAASSI
jgi:pilus assembly protein Flp/PilA